MLRRLALATVLMLSAPLIFAGDAARFVNLGFSTDEHTFMFAQYGVNRSSSAPYAEIYTVDVERNSFVSDGVFDTESERPVSPGQDGSAALFSLLREASSVISDRSIDHLRQGRIVYARLNEDAPQESVEFRDFNTGDHYTARLNQQQEGSGTEARAKFHIELTRDPEDGEQRSYTMGRPDHFREGVSEYRLHQGILSPNERSIVFVVEIVRPTDEGHSLRYMVETLNFDD
ncbi:MAG: DUF2259 domain-containing protein [Spirochaetia bacterium]